MFIIIIVFQRRNRARLIRHVAVLIVLMTEIRLTTVTFRTLINVMVTYT
jgi:hypothetical protein